MCKIMSFLGHPNMVDDRLVTEDFFCRKALDGA